MDLSYKSIKGDNSGIQIKLGEQNQLVIYLIKIYKYSFWES